MNRDNVITCRNCNPPSIDDAQWDEWACSDCRQKFKLDRSQRTWWPEQLWDKRYEKAEIPEAGSSNKEGGQ